MGLPPPAATRDLRGLDHRGAGGKTIASTTRAWRVLETSHPPTYYLPSDAFFAEGVLRETAGSSWCEWKGQASYYDLVTDTRVAPKAAWSYPNPNAGFEPIAGAIAVMAAQVDRCTVNGERVVAQPGGFYGGWITSRVAGRSREFRVDGLVAIPGRCVEPSSEQFAATAITRRPHPPPRPRPIGGHPPPDQPRPRLVEPVRMSAHRPTHPAAANETRRARRA